MPELPQTPDDFDVPGSRPLRNRRHESFCHAIVRGLNATKAYVKVGYAAHANNASRLHAQSDIQQRIEWLRVEVAKRVVHDAVWIKERLAKHAENLTATFYDEDTGLKMPGPMFNAAAGARALELLGKEHGLFKEKIELGGQVQVANRELLERLSPEERALMRGLLVAAAARAPRPANDDAPAEGVAREQSAQGLLPR